MQRRKVIAICLLSLVLAGIVYIIHVEEVHAALGWQAAIDVKKLYGDIIPHYGAAYAASCGSQQYYTGPSGQPAGYSSLDWWPLDIHWALLLSKSWLLGDWGERTTPGYHHAYMSCYGR
jgi:hypothetical protein